MLKANKNTGWTPDKNHHTIDTFAEAVKKRYRIYYSFQT